MASLAARRSPRSASENLRPAAAPAMSAKLSAKTSVVAELALPYLLVKPAHLITPVRWK